eukprot:scaffold507732_cov15-Prasinocladus_malaysianus.AAC.1
MGHGGPEARQRLRCKIALGVSRARFIIVQRAGPDGAAALAHTEIALVTCTGSRRSGRAPS